MERVTDILRKAGHVDASHFTPEARDRGTAVHLATQLHDEGALDTDYEWGDAKAQARFQAYERFLREMNVEILGIEIEVVHPVLDYIGHLDRLVAINGLRGVLDIKPPGKERWHALQLSAYQQAAGGGVQDWPNRWNLYLAEGKYQLDRKKTSMMDDWNVFRAALTTVRWRTG